ncbi:hypothetical protein G7Y79_00053g088140 [Physcia stellaris]|nr:hypothetical protein G7Y79_00053g088140 [Physcia stellaris]
MATTIPRFLLPRANVPLQGVYTSSSSSAQSVTRRASLICRYASTAPSKPIVLEKPERFNPPSHPARLNRKPPRQYSGPRLSETQKEEQKTKQYPNSFPPEGTWRYWFLTNRQIHIYIVLGFLSFLAATAWKQSFYHTCKFTHLLPPGSYFWSHPIDFISQWSMVYKMHVEQRSQVVAEMRQKRLDDIEKRNAYRKAHGIKDPQGVWGFGRRLEYYDSKEDVEKAVGEVARAEDASPVTAEPAAVGKGEYLDFEGKRKPLKKWFGIWLPQSHLITSRTPTDPPNQFSPSSRSRPKPTPASNDAPQLNPHLICTPPTPPTHLPMAPTLPPTLSPAELAYLHTSLSLTPPIRPDARSATTFRPLVAETSLLPACNGSARLCFADGTEALGEGAVGDEKWVEVTVEIPGQRDDDAMVVFLGAMIREALVGDGMLILLISPLPSSPLPLLSLTTHLALLSTSLPASISAEDEDPLFNDDWDAAVPLYPPSTTTHQQSKPPITLLIISVGVNIFFDPSAPELAVADAVLAISVTRTEGGIKVLAIRTVDSPARLASAAGGAMEGKGKGDQGVWRPPRGGMKRDVVRKMIRLVTERGGVADEVLDGLEGLVMG